MCEWWKEAKPENSHFSVDFSKSKCSWGRVCRNGSVWTKWEESDRHSRQKINYISSGLGRCFICIQVRELSHVWYYKVKRCPPPWANVLGLLGTSCGSVLEGCGTSGRCSVAGGHRAPLGWVFRLQPAVPFFLPATLWWATHAAAHVDGASPSHGELKSTATLSQNKPLPVRCFCHSNKS